MNDVQSAAHVHVTGIVQGVGFRPFIFGLAERLHLYGWVQNTAAGVDIEIEGSQQEVQSFLDALWEEAPPLAHIDDIDVQPHDPTGFGTFEIIQSRGTEGEYQPVSPDVSICEDCANCLTPLIAATGIPS